MAAITMNPTLGDVLKREYDPHYCRDAGTLLTGQNLTAGAVLARVTVATTAASVTVTAGTNTGNGTLTKDATTPVLAGATAGIYAARCIEAAANGGVFEVLNPEGEVIGSVAVGQTFAREIKFVIADGSTDFAVGDSFTFAVAEGSGKLVQVALAAAANGTHRPVGVLLQDVDATSADKPCVMLARGPAVLSADQVVWHADFNTAAKKAPKIAALAALGIIIRPTA